jgi:hypothetical protein
MLLLFGPCVAAVDAYSKAFKTSATTQGCLKDLTDTVVKYRCKLTLAMHPHSTSF